jgi:hypothetical protein
VLNAAAARDVAQRERLPGVDFDAGRNLPSHAKVARGAFAGPARGHATFALLARKIFGGDGSGLDIGNLVKIVQGGVEQVTHRGDDFIVFSPGLRNCRAAGIPYNPAPTNPRTGTRASMQLSQSLNEQL